MKPALSSPSAQPTPRVAPLVANVRELILAVRAETARAVDSGLVTLYWHIGRCIHKDLLNKRRVEYRAQIVSAPRRQLIWTHFNTLISIDDPLDRDFYGKKIPITDSVDFKS